jgi:hypothetical protein
LKPNYDFSSSTKVELVEQGIPNFSYFHPSDADDKSIKGKHAYLVFHVDATIMTNINDIAPVITDTFYGKSLPAKLTIKFINLFYILST